MHSYKCTVSYEGSRYNGWQKQGNTSNTIQGKLEETLSKMLDEPVEIFGSGRTDAGVHALGQVFHFHCNVHILEEFSSGGFLSTLNSFLPKDIRVLAIIECDQRFHARLHAKEKTYHYQIDISSYGNLFLRNTSHHINKELNIDAMKKGANYLLGTHDFKSFCSNKRMKKSSVRTIYKIDITHDSTNELLLLTYTGNGFLYNMVRIMTGTLIEIGLGHRTPEDILLALEGCDRGLAGHTAPPQGLFLVSVSYTENSSRT